MEVMKVELYDGNVNIDQNQLYFLLDNLQFLNTKLSKDYEAANNLVQIIWVQLTAQAINSSQLKKTIVYNDLKLVVFTAYNIWQPKWMLSTEKDSPKKDILNESQLE